MKTTRLPEHDLGQLAAPVFLCVLGAVLLGSLSAATGKHRAPSAEDLQAWNIRLGRATNTLAEVRALRAEVEARLRLRELQAADLARREEARPLATRLAGITNGVQAGSRRRLDLDELKRQALAAEREITQARARLAAATTRATNQYGALFGSYQGRAVVLDCEGDHVTVHPGGRRIAADNLDEAVPALRPDIEKAGHVAIIARPSAFEQTYDRACHVVGELLEQLNRPRAADRQISRSTFPLAAEAKLADVLPKGTL